MFGWADYLQFSMIIVPLALLCFIVPKTIRHSRTIGLARGLARLALDPIRLRRLLAFISLIVASFLSLGIFAAVGVAYQTPPDWVVFGIAGSFFAGCAGLFFLVANGLPPSELTLTESLQLNEAEPEVLSAVESDPSATPAPRSSSMYVVPTLQGERTRKTPARSSGEDLSGVTASR